MDENNFKMEKKNEKRVGSSSDTDIKAPNYNTLSRCSMKFKI